MKDPIKIMHIAKDYQVVFILIKEGPLIKSTVSLEAALTMLNNETFDLILSEPQNIAILTPQSAIKKEIASGIYLERTNPFAK